MLRRLGAMLYDALVMIAVWMVTLFVMVGLNGGQFVHGAVVQSILFLELFAFFAWFWIRDGQTIGMRAWRIRLASNRAPRLTLDQVTMRFIGAIAGAALLGIGYWWLWIDPHRRTWSDILSDSHVSFEPKVTA